MNKLLIGGTFDNTVGKASYAVKQLYDALGNDWNYINGGNINIIKEFNPRGIDVLIWMPNVSNDENKIIDELKKINQKMILIQSKRVIEKEYKDSDVVGRLLKSHALLGIKITKENDTYKYKLLDPLGNMWAYSNEIKDVGYAIEKRLSYLLDLKRIGSTEVVIENQNSVPEEFVQLVKKYGNEFTKFVNAINPNRLLGNASTRCAKGFPAIKMDDYVFVTRRNVDKQSLSPEDFVLVKSKMEEKVMYAGDKKPSVDTPIQLKLFDYYKNVKFMIHGHAYVKNGLFTENKVPCGYVEEFEEIKKLVPNHQETNFKINLRGHGCLILADNLQYLESQIENLYSRPFPEE